MIPSLRDGINLTLDCVADDRPPRPRRRRSRRDHRFARRAAPAQRAAAPRLLRPHVRRVRRSPLAPVPAVPGRRACAHPSRRLDRHRRSHARLGPRLFVRVLPRQLHAHRTRGAAARRRRESPAVAQFPRGDVRRGVEHVHAAGALHHRLARRGRRAAEALMAAALIAILSLTVLGIPVTLALDRAARGFALLGLAFLYGSGCAFFILLFLPWNLTAVTVAASVVVLGSWFVVRRQPLPTTNYELRTHAIDLATLIPLTAYAVYATL